MASLLRGRIYNRVKHKLGGDRKSKDHIDPLILSADTLATQYGVGSATIKRDGQFARAVDVVKEACCSDSHHRKQFLDNGIYRIAQMLQFAP